jgi:hypothetical protein
MKPAAHQYVSGIYLDVPSPSGLAIAAGLDRCTTRILVSRVSDSMRGQVLPCLATPNPPDRIAP